MLNHRSRCDSSSCPSVNRTCASLTNAKTSPVLVLGHDDIQLAPGQLPPTPLRGEMPSTIENMNI